MTTHAEDFDRSPLCGAPRTPNVQPASLPYLWLIDCAACLEGLRQDAAGRVPGHRKTSDPDRVIAVERLEAIEQRLAEVST